MTSQTLTEKETKVLAAMRALDFGTLTVTVQRHEPVTLKTEVVEKLV